MTKALELAGKKLGKLNVIKRVGNNESGNSQWLCICECGNEHITTGSRLNTKKVLSCGCIQREGAKKRATRHNLSGHKLYHIRKEMIARTENPNNSRFENYGGRGISVCEEWLSNPNGITIFYDWAIRNGYREGLSIDRIDNDGNYEPSNCRWADNSTQASNKTTNRFIEFKGEIKTIKQWAEELGFNRSLIPDRLRHGWDVERALTTPPRKLNK